MKKIFASITSFAVLASICLPFNVSAAEYIGESVDQENVLSGYLDVVYPEQTCLLGDTSKIDSMWLKLVVLDDDNNSVTLREFNTKYDKHSCYSIDTSSVDINTPGTYQYSVKSLAGMTETFLVPNEKGDYEYYDVEMTDYVATASLIVSDKERLLSLGVDSLTLEVGNTYNIEIYSYKSDELSFELTDDKIAYVDMWLENEAASNYRITANSEGETVLTFTAPDGQVASVDISIVAEGSLPKTTTAVWYKDSDTTTVTTTATTNSSSDELYFNTQYGYVPVEIGLYTGAELVGYDDGKFYEVGDSPIEFTIDDEQIAKLGPAQGIGVNVLGVSVGETMLNAKTPDGRTASIRVVVKEAPSTSTTAVWNHETTPTTTTTAVIEQITDIDQIREMLTEFIAENELDAKVVSNKEYPGYQPIVIEYNSEKAANMAILEYTQENNIDTSNVGFVPIVDGVAITTVNPDSTATTTTTTTTVPDADDPNTTTTAVFDYSTFLEYDSSPMKVGETRTVRFYNPELNSMTNMNAYEVSENISYSYEEGSDTLTITALAPGKARMYIMGEGCSFGCYLNLDVVDDTSTTTSSNDGDEELPQTGYSDIYKVIAGLASLITISGAALVVKTRKENE